VLADIGAGIEPVSDGGIQGAELGDVKTSEGILFDIAHGTVPFSVEEITETASAT
jgi:hypothetical protein